MRNGKQGEGIARVALAALVGLLAVAAPIGAHAIRQVKSLYTTIDLATCRSLAKHADGGTWRCPGLGKYPVYFAEGDLRQFVSVGPNAEKTRAAGQTLAPINTIFERRRSRATIEWRFVIRGGEYVPYATIVRYFTKSSRGRGEVLVVSHVSPDQVCHVAHIDALANPDAIALARTIADRKARSFDCRQDAAIEGATGRSPM